MGEFDDFRMFVEILIDSLVFFAVGTWSDPGIQLSGSDAISGAQTMEPFSNG